MNLLQYYHTKNECYVTGKPLNVGGFMLHSTGANNPNLKRYVGSDTILGTNQYNNDWNRPRPGGRQVCVHGFIGKLADGTIATCQTLPWDMRGWHCGGKGNDIYIGVEICEDGLQDSAYFNAVYREAVELVAHLQGIYGFPNSAIICHAEGHQKGIASNHGDVLHWFPKHGKTMNDFRQDVAKLRQQPGPTPDKLYRVQVGAFAVRQNAVNMQAELKSKGYDAFITE